MYKKQKLSALAVVSDPAMNKSMQMDNNCFSKIKTLKKLLK